MAAACRVVRVADSDSGADVVRSAAAAVVAVALVVDVAPDSPCWRDAHSSSLVAHSPGAVDAAWYVAAVAPTTVAVAVVDSSDAANDAADADADDIGVVRPQPVPLLDASP